MVRPHGSNGALVVVAAGLAFLEVTIVVSLPLTTMELPCLRGRSFHRDDVRLGLLRLTVITLCLSILILASRPNGEIAIRNEMLSKTLSNVVRLI